MHEFFRTALHEMGKALRLHLGRHIGAVRLDGAWADVQIIGDLLGSPATAESTWRSLSLSGLTHRILTVPKSAPAFMASTARATSPCPVITIDGIDLVIAEIAQKLYTGHVRHSQVRDENPVSEAAR